MKESGKSENIVQYTSERINVENAEHKEDIPDKNEDNKEKKEKKLNENNIKDINERIKNFDTEVDTLLKSKKDSLQNKFEGYFNEFKELNNIDDVIEKYSKENESSLSSKILKESFSQENIKIIKDNMRKYLDERKWRIYISAFFFLAFYLAGIFQLLDLFDATKKITGIIFKSFFYNKPKENNETFKDLYMNSCFKNIPEFDFAFVTSFIGSLPLNLVGFFFSSLLFTILNSFLFVNFLKLDLEKEKYDFLDFFHVSIYFVLFFITFGAISLFAYEKISEGIMYYGDQIKLYIDEKDNNNDKDNKKENIENNEDQKVEVKVMKIEKKEPEKKIEKDKLESDHKMDISLFIIISLGIIFAYIINKGANYCFYYKASKFFNKKFNWAFLIIYVGNYILSLICYFAFHYQILLVKEIENYEDEEKKSSGFYKICGFLIYYEKVDNRDKTILNEETQEKKNAIIEKYKSILEGNAAFNSNVSCWSIIFPCYKDCRKENKFSEFYCASCKLGCRKFYYNSVKNKLNIIKCCTCCECQRWCCEGCKECCCLCCGKLDKLKETYEEEETFCYIYQTQRKCSWFCDLFFQNNVISLIIHNISIEIGIIGFEKKLNENLESRKIEENLKSIGAYLGILIIISIIFIIIFCIRYSVSGSCTILGKTFTFYFIFLIIFYACDITLSGLSLFGKDKIESITDDWLILLPLAYTKYINFLVLDRLVGILDKENIDILSNSIIMTSVFFVYDIIVFLIADFLDCNSDILIFFQFIAGCIIFLTSIIGEMIPTTKKEVTKK